MNLYEELILLEQDAAYDLTPECSDRLIRIAWNIVHIYRPNATFTHKLQMFEDYFEHWGTCYERFWAMYHDCMDIFRPVSIEYTDSE
jgi:hypothetical protein